MPIAAALIWLGTSDGEILKAWNREAYFWVSRCHWTAMLLFFSWVLILIVMLPIRYSSHAALTFNHERLLLRVWPLTVNIILSTLSWINMTLPKVYLNGGPFESLTCSKWITCVKWWCPGPESNRHASRRGILSPLRLPISPPGHWREEHYYGTDFCWF